MPTPRKPFARSSLALAALMLLSAAPTGSALAANACTWQPATGNWADGGSWSCGVVPTGPNQDTAAIASGKTATVNSGQSIWGLTNAGTIDIAAFSLTLQGGGSTMNSGTINVGTATVTGSLLAYNDMANAGGLINISNGSVLDQFSSAITGGTITTTGTGALVVFSNGANFLNGVTVNGLVDAVSIANARERVTNGMTLNGTVNIGNGGIVSLDSTGVPNQTIAGTGVFNLADSSARLSIEGSGTTTLGAGIIVQGQGNLGSAAFSSGNNTLVNNGQILANTSGGTLTLSQPGSGGAVTNNGTLGASNGGTLALQSNITNGGTISAGNTGVVEQDGVTISGGLISTTGSGVLRANSSGGNYLDNTTVAGTVDLSTIANARERITDGLTLNGNINIANGGILSLDSNGSTGNTQVVSGTGSINLNDAGALLSVEGTGNTTLGAGITVHGQGSIGQASYSSGNNTLTSNGLISADVHGGTLSLNAPASGGSFINNGTLQAINGGTLVLSTNITANPGSQIVSGTGSTVIQNGVAINGSFSSSGGGLFTATSSGGNILNNVQFSGNLDASSIANARERIGNGLTLNGAVNIGNGGIVSLDSTLGASNSIGGTATFNLNDSSAQLSVEGSGSTTLGAGVTVRGQGTFGGALFSSGNNALTNNGLVSADVQGATLNVATPANGGTFTNNGTLQAINGATLLLSTSILANAGSQILAGNGSQVVQSGVTLDGALNTTGTGVITVTSNGGNYLNGATLTGTLDATSIQNSRERVVNGLTLNGAVNIGNGGILSLDAGATTGNAQTIAGNASINMNDASATVSIEGTGTTMLGSGVVIHGEGNLGQADYSSGNNTLINNGRISADISGGMLTIYTPGNGGILNNLALVDARNGGTLNLSTNVANAGGTINAQAGSTVLQNGVTISGGTVSTATTGAFAVTNNGNNVLSGVTVSGNVDMSSAQNSRERIFNGLTLDGVVNIANGGVLSLDAGATNGNAQTISGTGSLNMNDPGAWVSIEGTGTTTIGSGVTIHGEGNLGQANYSSGNNTLINNGLISADIAGGTLTINTPANGGILTNMALVDARNGGTLNLSTNVANAGGTINAQAGSTVLQNGVNISGGTISTAPTGAFTVTNNGNNFLTGVTIAGNVDMTSQANARERIDGGATLNGTISIANGGVLSLDSTSVPNQTIAGTGTIALNDAGARLALEGTGTTTLGSGITVQGQGNIGVPLFSSGNNTLVNNGTIVANAAGGTLTINAPANGGYLTGTGTLQANGGTLALATGSDVTQGKLVIGGAGSALTLSGNNVIISSDYTNAQSGSGNTFNNHAGISGSGSILASGTPLQVISGAGVTGGNTAAATLTIGNVRVGTTTFNYNVANADATGPTLRGAIQTNVNGANLSDARLGGTGATAGAYASGAQGAAGGNLGVSFTVASTGALAPLTGQSVNLRSNFDNVADQKLNIVLASNAAAYQAAAGQVQTPALSFGTVQVGQTISQKLVVGNTATGAAGYVEDLNAAFGSSNGTGAASISGTGSLNGILAGTNSTAANGTMTVSVNTQAAGTINGGIAVNYATNGTVNGVSNGLGVASVGSQNYAVSGLVVNAASPTVTTPTIALGAARVGDAPLTGFVGISNTAVGAAQAALDATITSNGAPVTASGNVSLLAAGQTSSNQLSVGLGTATAGNFTGANAKSATIGLVSDAANIGNCGANCQMTLASQQVAVTGKVYSPAAVQANTSAVNFGVVHVGDQVTASGVSITNSGATSALSDVLRGSIGGATGPFTASGSFSSLAAQATDTSSLTVGLNTTSSGAFTGSATATFVSHDGDLAELALGTKTVALTGTVDNYAKAAFEVSSGATALSQSGNTYTLNFGTVTQGATGLTDILAVLNSATGLADLLGGSFTSGGSATGFDLSGFEAFSGLGAGQSSSGLTVGLDTSEVGSFMDTITLHSAGSNASGYSGALDDLTLVLEGSVATTAAVPEPRIGLLLLAGLGVLFGARRVRGRRDNNSVER
jgi:hypothetical protein